MLGPASRLDHAYGIVMREGTEGLQLHGGRTPYDPAQYYHYRNGKMDCGLTVVTWALSDAPPGAGGPPTTIRVKTSHLATCRVKAPESCEISPYRSLPAPQLAVSRGAERRSVSWNAIVITGMRVPKG